MGRGVRPRLLRHPAGGGGRVPGGRRGRDSGDRRPGRGQQSTQVCPDCLLVFIEPPSFEELEARLRGRQDMPEERVRRRLDTARGEMARAGEFHHRIVNRDLTDAVRRTGTRDPRTIQPIQGADRAGRTQRRGDREQGGRAIQTVHLDPEANGRAEHRRTKPQVDTRGLPDRMAIVIQEILQDKIFLDASGVGTWRRRTRPSWRTSPVRTPVCPAPPRRNPARPRGRRRTSDSRAESAAARRSCGRTSRPLSGRRAGTPGAAPRSPRTRHLTARFAGGVRQELPRTRPAPAASLTSLRAPMRVHTNSSGTSVPVL